MILGVGADGCFFDFYFWILHPVARVIKVIGRTVPRNNFKGCLFYLYAVKKPRLWS
jgi:hypothetical protein